MTVEAVHKPGCLGFIIARLRRLLGLQDKKPGTLPYKRRDDFLSSIELSYYKVLTSVLGSRATVLAKVRLADILFVPRPNENISFFNRIAQRHVDFLLCESFNMQPVLVIELDDSSHNRPARKKRDQFMDEALRAAGVPILRVRAQKEYSKDEVVAQLTPFLARTPEAKAAQSSEAELTDQSVASVPVGDTPPLCPKCGVPMVVRVASQGRHKGHKFFGCLNYPRCTQVLPIGDA